MCNGLCTFMKHKGLWQSGGRPVVPGSCGGRNLQEQGQRRVVLVGSVTTSSSSSSSSSSQGRTVSLSWRVVLASGSLLPGQGDLWLQGLCSVLRSSTLFWILFFPQTAKRASLSCLHIFAFWGASYSIERAGVLRRWWVRGARPPSFLCKWQTPLVQPLLPASPDLASAPSAPNCLSKYN